jgi:hypothetical protein
MNAVPPIEIHDGAERVTFGANQPQYFPLPAARSRDGLVLTEWEFTAEELAVILAGGRLRLWTHTFNAPFQPVSLEIVP